MAYLLAPHSSALQTNTTKFKRGFIAHLENVLVHMIDAQDVAIFKPQKYYVRNKQKLSEYIHYAQLWQVLLVIFSYVALTCDIILVKTLYSL